MPISSTAWPFLRADSDVAKITQKEGLLAINANNINATLMNMNGFIAMEYNYDVHKKWEQQ